jgi:hypothetical protein
MGKNHWHIFSEKQSTDRGETIDRFWMIRFQHDAGTGSDNICLRPGESERGYEVALQTAAKYRDTASNRIAP